MRQRWILGTERRCSGSHALAGLLALGLLAAALAAPLEAADWPQWRGPNRDGISTETGWLARWPRAVRGGLWTAQVGEGYSSVAVKDGRVYTMGNAGERDTSTARRGNRARLWKYSYPARAATRVERAPRRRWRRIASTPSARRPGVLPQRLLGREALGKRSSAGDRRRAAPLGVCRLAARLRQTRHLQRRHRRHRSGPATGQTVWKSGAGTAGYASPVPYTVGAARCGDLCGVGPRRPGPGHGRSLWQHPWRTDYDVNAADPPSSPAIPSSSRPTTNGAAPCSGWARAAERRSSGKTEHAEPLQHLRAAGWLPLRE